MTPNNFPARALEANYGIADTGSGGVLVPDKQFGITRLITAGAEARTVPAPLKAGIVWRINMVTDGGDATVTFATAYDETGSTVMTFSATGQYVDLISVEQGAGTYVWRVDGYDGVTGPVVAMGSGAFDSIVGTDATLEITGRTAAAGGAVAVAGAAASTAANAGGLVSLTGGLGNTSGAGGAVTLLSGAGGATGAGGAATLTGGRGGATSGAAGVATVTAGAGGATPSTVTGGAASLVGGASGAGATGTGGAAKVTGGDSLATNGDGGSVVLGGGAKVGTGFIGNIVLGNAQLTPIFYPQAAPAADGADTPFTATVAQLVAGLISMTPTTGRAITTPTGAAMDLGLALTDIPATFGFDFTIQNRAAFAATDDIITLVAGATGATVTGSAVVSPGSAARFRATRTAADTWIFYKIAG